MPKITFQNFEGQEKTIEVAEGLSLMEAAIRNSVSGIDGDCGGACACATCHIYIPEEWQEKAGTPNDMEHSMLDFVEDREENSRLACQIKATSETDGMTVILPERQH